MTLDHTKVPGNTIMVLGIASATDEFAEREWMWGRSKEVQELQSPDLHVAL